MSLRDIKYVIEKWMIQSVNPNSEIENEWFFDLLAIYYSELYAYEKLQENEKPIDKNINTLMYNKLFGIKPPELKEPEIIHMVKLYCDKYLRTVSTYFSGNFIALYKNSIESLKPDTVINLLEYYNKHG